jgi:hypothetical protein
MGSRSRRWLNQSTHSRVAYSTSSIAFQGPRNAPGHPGLRGVARSPSPARPRPGQSKVTGRRRPGSGRRRRRPRPRTRTRTRSPHRSDPRPTTGWVAGPTGWVAGRRSLVTLVPGVAPRSTTRIMPSRFRRHPTRPRLAHHQTPHKPLQRVARQLPSIDLPFSGHASRCVLPAPSLGRPGPKPQRGLARLHGLVGHGQQLTLQGV